MTFWRRIQYQGLTLQTNCGMGGEKQSVDYRIPEDIVEDIRIHADIVEIISEYVSLQRKGKTF